MIATHPFPEPRWLLVAGDVHGDSRFVAHLCEQAADTGCDTLLQLGDFGYWEHTRDGERFLDGTHRTLRRHGLQLVWVDGNHENLPLLWDRYPVDEATGFAPVRGRVHYAPRGARWTWRDVAFLAAGGAYSIDQDWRRDAMAKGALRMWWPQEELTDTDVERCAAGGRADVVIAHDCPAGVDVGPLLAVPAADVNRRRLRRVVDAVQPHAVWHGHYHRRTSAMLVLAEGRRVAVEGLGHNEGRPSDATMVVDLEELAAALGAG